MRRFCMSSRQKAARLRESSPVVLPSMLLCDFGNLEQEVRALEQAGFSGLHLDVMDGVFVPNFSYGLTLVKTFRQLTHLFLDVHLMMVKPENYVQQFADAGADLITFHAEAADDPVSIVKQIHDAGSAAGIAVNPDTPVSAIAEALPVVDLALVMSVHAGFGGQPFISDVLSKLPQIRELRGDHLILEIDGGVNADTIGQCIEAGAQWLVVGSGVFMQDDYAQALEMLTQRMCLNDK